MDKGEKLLKKMKANPNGWRIEDVEIIAKRYNLRIRKPGGSHVIVKRDGVSDKVSIPAKKPIKPVYIKQFVKLIETLEGMK